MKGLLSRRPSPAMIVALVALVVAMVGTGYAATKLPRNSVGTKQIKANAVTTAKLKREAVTGAKIKKKTITGADINLEKLGTVPSANVANTANALAPMEATHLVGAPNEPGFEGGAFNVPGSPGFGFQPAGFYKDHNGVVHLQGFVVAGAPPAGAVFTLPPGYRPAAGSIIFFEQFPAAQTVIVAGTGTSSGGLAIDGKIITEPEGPVSLDGITFRAAG
jgi:hypothetical protein